MATAAAAAARKAPAADGHMAMAAAELAGVVSKLLQSEQDETAAGVTASPSQAAAAPIAKKADAGAEQARDAVGPGPPGAVKRPQRFP